ncbi:hypothetical protein HNQ99_000369 [Rhizorhapis suberifaciens]|uniref:Transposase TnpC homeodomain domain-containing protein n=2 Tax=Rhizorhapis suberifaciens TaxID=13656 RepID=A0A840HR17_9SPHN|nr:hypothetical protein [Rhizorhapis suberifaciens]MBB4640089.1 hypothetical protein [Rhizorhapis suberifaciens]
MGHVATAADLPDDVATLKAMVLAGLEREARMQHIIDQITRTTFGKRSEKLIEDQLALASMISMSPALNWRRLASRRRAGRRSGREGKAGQRGGRCRRT